MHSHKNVYNTSTMYPLSMARMIIIAASIFVHVHWASRLSPLDLHVCSSSLLDKTNVEIMC